MKKTFIVFSFIFSSVLLFADMDFNAKGIIQFTLPDNIEISEINHGIYVEDGNAIVIGFVYDLIYNDVNVLFYFDILLSNNVSASRIVEYTEMTRIIPVQRPIRNIQGFADELRVLRRRPDRYEYSLNGNDILRMVYVDWASGISNDISAYYIQNTGDPHLPELVVDFFNARELGEEFIPIMDQIVASYEFVYPEEMFQEE